jgi:hypothetical protein
MAKQPEYSRILCQNVVDSTFTSWNIVKSIIIKEL